MKVLGFALLGLLALYGCGGGGSQGGAAAPAPVASGALPSSSVSTYYTAVESYYSGAPQTISGVGTYPSDFIAAVEAEGSGKIGDNAFLNYNGAAFSLDALPRDAQGNPLLPYLTAAADPSTPFGETFSVACGACSAYSWPRWIVSDRSSAATGPNVRLYVGLQNAAAMPQPPFSGSSIIYHAPAASSAIWRPSSADTYQWILSAALDMSAHASVYDIDDFGANASDVNALHALGRRVVCYIDVGSLENYRPDASAFPASAVGNVYSGYPNERWLDIRRIDQIGAPLQARFDLCASKGFDAVEPDNIDGFENATGFPLTASDQLVFNTWVAMLAHERGLSVALKNDADQLASLQPYFDFGLEEDCWQQGWCAMLAPMRAAGKPVFTVEYLENTPGATFQNVDCQAASAAGFSAVLKHRALDAWVQYC